MMILDDQVALRDIPRLVVDPRVEVEADDPGRLIPLIPVPRGAGIPEGEDPRPIQIV